MLEESAVEEMRRNVEIWLVGVALKTLITPRTKCHYYRGTHTHDELQSVKYKENLYTTFDEFRSEISK